ncbi:MAG: DUF4157 domain-containing protein [Bacteroidota bacterium]
MSQQLQSKQGQTTSAVAKQRVQPKLTINQPGDRYEQEADAMAERVGRMSWRHGPTPHLQGVQAGAIQRKEQTKSSPATAWPSSSLTSSGGQPLSSPTRQLMEGAFQTNFSSVRLHTNESAARMSQGIQARAFTHGSHIYFNQGQYQPHSTDGRKLLAHELTHVVQQRKAPRKLGHVQRKELGGGMLRRPPANRQPQDWFHYDRMIWQRISRSSTGPSIVIPRSNTFARAAVYNTRNNRPQEYQTISQRHDYYDLISYVLQYDQTVPASLRNVRFFHAATIVTGSPGIGTTNTVAGAIVLQAGSRRILRQVNAVLFAANMQVIRNLMFQWREPRNPNNPAGRISSFEFDVQMVEMEQDLVEQYIRRNQSQFTPSIVANINGTMNPDGFGQSLNPSRASFLMARSVLGVQALDFTQMLHRKAIGFAAVHLLHRRNNAQYVQFMRSRYPQLRRPSTQPANP